MSNVIMKVEKPHLILDRDRHGNERLYVRIHGLPKIRIREPVGSPEFDLAYHAAVAQLKGMAANPAHEYREPTFEWLGRQYIKSAEFQRFSPRDRATRHGVLDACFEEPLRPGAKETIGQCPLRLLQRKHVKLLVDRKSLANLPGAANNRLKYISALLSWGVENEHITSNPAAGIKPVAYETDGYHPWTTEEIQRFEERWPIGSKPRLAMALMLHLGLRGSDVRVLGRQHIRDGWLRLKVRKTAKHKSAEPLEIPILPELQRILDAGPCGDMNLIVTEYGRPFTDRGFGQWFSKRCEDAGLPECTAHGLRKVGATRRAEHGATAHQLQAMYGWSNLSQAEVYTRKADRKRLAGAAAPLLKRDTE